MLTRLKQPLEQVLLGMPCDVCLMIIMLVCSDQFVSILCDDLEALTKKHGSSHRDSTWGVSHHQFGCNQRRNSSENRHLSHMNLGAEIKLLRQAPVQPEPQPAQPPPEEQEQDTQMAESASKPQCDESDVYTQAILGYLSNTGNIRCSASSRSCRRSGRGCGRRRRRRSLRRAGAGAARAARGGGGVAAVGGAVAGAGAGDDDRDDARAGA